MEYLIFIHLLVVSGLLLSELFQWIFNQFLLQRYQKKRHGQCLGEKQISFLYTFLLYQASLVWTFIVNSQPIFVQKCQKKRYQVETWFLYTLLLYHSFTCLNFSSKKTKPIFASKVSKEASWTIPDFYSPCCCIRPPPVWTFPSCSCDLCRRRCCYCSHHGCCRLGRFCCRCSCRCFVADDDGYVNDAAFLIYSQQS